MMNLQPTFQSKNILVRPLLPTDFEDLYQAASDPKVWEQHPNKNRYQREVFMNYFEGAILSKGAFAIIDLEKDKIIGSTRFYDYNEEEKSVLIGYTFIECAYWGKGINPLVKKLLMDYAFQYVEKIYFHIGADNIRSQIAIERLGAKKVREMEVEYYGEPSKLNFEYILSRQSV
jgi:N-acetyltransferase